MGLFSTDIKGRIKNFPSFMSTPLLPVYEAIVNSFQSIETRQKYDSNIKGRINVNILRSSQETISKDILPPIIGFEISDNGIGFTNQNMQSFLKSDSTYKESIGGRGVGRFSWLKAFNFAEISSTYKEEHTFRKRKFIFSAENKEIDDFFEKAADECHRTIVKLKNCTKEYEKFICNQQADSIATGILHYCLIYFIDKDCPELLIKDGHSEQINLNRLFEKKFKIDDNKESFNIKDEKFKILHIKIEDKIFGANRLFVCANNRLVKKIKLENEIVDLTNEMFNKNKFWYVGVLSGDYLDNNVDMSRLSFNFSDKESNFLYKISSTEIINESCICIKKYLEKYLSEIRKEKVQNIYNYIYTEVPQYKHLLKYASYEIENIKPNLNKENLDDELYKIKRNIIKQSGKQYEEFLDCLEKTNISSEEYEKKINQCAEKITDINKSNLTEYIVHRKAIIDILKLALCRQNDGKFSKEKCIHSLIYPMKHTSESIDYSLHNLWLIDEKLSYCDFISSDESLCDEKGKIRPDILFLDKPVVMSDDINNGIFSSIVIFEFKKPMREDYSNSDNPITQLLKYVDKIRSNKEKDKNGRLIKVNDSTKYYLYAICDITESLKKIIEEKDFKKTLDEQGYYTFHSTYKAYIEILSYDKIIMDAKKRNRVLFEKLGLN